MVSLGTNWSGSTRFSKQCVFATLFGLVGYAFEHGGVLEHVGNDHEADLTSSKEDLVQMVLLAVSSCHVDIVQSHVHSVLSLHEVASVELP